MSRQMQVVSIRVHPLMKVLIEDAAAHEGQALAAFMRESAWGMAQQPGSPAGRQWAALTQVVRVLGWEAVYGICWTPDESETE